MSADESGAGALERCYRMTLDFRVLTGGIGEKGVGTGDGENEGQVPEYVERQRRLLRALLSNEAALAEFLSAFQ